jgi:hypothetical protein
MLRLLIYNQYCLDLSSIVTTIYKEGQKMYTHFNVQNICLINLLVYLRYSFENVRR